MFYNNNTKVVEAAADIIGISSWQYNESNGEKLLTATFVLRGEKEFDSPDMFHLTDGTQQTMLFAPDPPPAHVALVETPSVEEDTTPKKRNGKQFVAPTTDTPPVTDTAPVASVDTVPVTDTLQESTESIGA